MCAEHANPLHIELTTIEGRAINRLHNTQAIHTPLALPSPFVLLAPSEARPCIPSCSQSMRAPQSLKLHIMSTHLTVTFTTPRRRRTSRPGTEFSKTLPPAPSALRTAARNTSSAWLHVPRTTREVSSAFFPAKPPPPARVPWCARSCAKGARGTKVHVRVYLITSFSGDGDAA